MNDKEELRSGQYPRSDPIHLMFLIFFNPFPNVSAKQFIYSYWIKCDVVRFVDLYKILAV
jgi:hypothetical protein